jgi:hypothetical protein
VGYSPRNEIAAPTAGRTLTLAQSWFPVIVGASLKIVGWHYGKTQAKESSGRASAGWEVCAWRPDLSS